MKIYLNRRPKDGPWGGGIKTVNKLTQTLKERGHQVVFKLEPEIDVIFCIDPRPNDYGEWYQHFLQYRKIFKSKIIQRVGDLGTHSKPELTSLVEQTIPFSDFLIFPSEWARDWIGYKGDNCEVVHNCPMEIFHKYKKKDDSLKNKIKLVTHHWSMNPKKGFSFYEKLENFVSQENDFEFCYIGRKPENINFSNHIPPLDAISIAKELPEHHVYITASIEEAGANHVLEAMAAGLPIVYHKDGGSIANYCKDYGLEYSSFDEMIGSIKRMIIKYKFYKNKVLSYNKTNLQVVEPYIKIITGA